jgi:hypothetical protein
MEGREWIFNNGTWAERQLANSRKIIKNSSSRNLEKNIVKIFKEYFGNI